MFSPRLRVEVVEVPVAPDVLAFLVDAIGDPVGDDVEFVDSDVTPFDGVVRYAIKSKTVSVAGIKVVVRSKVIVGGNVPKFPVNNNNSVNTGE